MDIHYNKLVYHDIDIYRIVSNFVFKILRLAILLIDVVNYLRRAMWKHARATAHFKRQPLSMKPFGAIVTFPNFKNSVNFSSWDVTYWSKYIYHGDSWDQKLSGVCQHFFESFSNKKVLAFWKFCVQAIPQWPFYFSICSVTSSDNFKHVDA